MNLSGDDAGRAREAAVVAIAVLLGTALGATAAATFGRADDLAYLFAAPGRWLALAWLVAALARRPATAVLAGGALLATALGAFELVPYDFGDSEGGRAAAQTLDTNYSLPWWLVAAGLAMGAGAAAWRAGHKLPGVSLLAAALTLDLAGDLARGEIGRLVPGFAGNPEPAAIACALLALPAAFALLSTRRAAVAVVAGAVLAGAVAALGAPLSSEQQLIEVIAAR